MSVADFGTTLAHLVRVCWSASAGQLHLASLGDSSPLRKSPPSSGLGGGSTPPSQGSEVAEEDDIQLHAGICVKQGNDAVSAKVVYYV